jgi:sulfatase maturation enzyme AslB (radical SAM superfamily)
MIMLYPSKQASRDLRHGYLTINVTQQCNLKCVYCYQLDRRNNRRNRISFEAASSAIEDCLTRNDGFEHVIIELIGGEVLLYSRFMKQLIDWTVARRRQWKKKFSFFIETNGTLLTDELKEWMHARRGILAVGISLDGTPEAHDLNRCGSYARIAPHFPFLLETWPEQPVKMTISPATLPSVYDGILHLTNLGFRVAANVPMEDIWGSGEEKRGHVDTFRREIARLVRYFATHADMPLPSLIDLPLHSIEAPDRDRAWCGAGINMVAVDEGDESLPCLRYASMSFDQSLWKEPLRPDQSRCGYCRFRPSCQTCEAHNWEVNGNPGSRTTFHCEFVKWQIWGTAQVHAMRLEKRMHRIRAMPPEEQRGRAGEIAAMEQHLSTVALVLDEFERNPRIDDAGMMPGWKDHLTRNPARVVAVDTA